GLRENLGDGTAQTAEHVVLLYCHDPPGTRCREHGVAVERLDRVHVEDAYGHALLPEQCRRLKGWMHGRSNRDQREIAAFPVGDGASQLEVATVLVNDGVTAASGAEVDRARVVDGVTDGGFEG